MMDETITYGHLFAKLRELGFTEDTFEFNGSPKREFIHPDYPPAVIFLPDEPDKPAHHMHVSGVIGMIRVNRIADPDLEFLRG